MKASGRCPKSGKRALIGLFHQFIGLWLCGAERVVRSRGESYEPGEVHEISRLGEMSHRYKQCEIAQPHHARGPWSGCPGTRCR